ncbi:TRAP transporter small permease [Paracoccus sediminicola]|uniref:TRAP transporter small permease n=1 Tax=Paracoccus sediminicola TaxID=3017783 RepID=UPI0022F0EB27|nr:TRAP transporter small permease subunit [Paracoccus sediminicola]WBU56299.1 TRAP transporter small permease subunit [Paracoccus sediminicola]
MLNRIYLGILNGMAVFAGLMLVWLLVAIVLAVVIRNLGAQPSAWFFLSTEYAMFYLTLLGAPWLVRKKGHVHIELLTSVLSPTALNILSRFVAAICTITSLVLAWKGLELVLMNIERSDYDVRAFFVPKWILTIAFPISFTLMAIEFARFVFGKEILHTGEAGFQE